MVYERDCFSDQSFAVQITLSPAGNGPSVVRQVLIGGRPAGTFGLAPKSHLVPWLSFCDGLRADLAGQTLQRGLWRVARLCEWAEGLPSQRLADALRRVKMPQVGQMTDTGSDDKVVARTPAWWHKAATEHMGATLVMANDYLSMADEENPDEEREHALLQDLAAAYLHYRNTVPLSAMPVPKAAGPPKRASAFVRSREARLETLPLPSDDTDPLRRHLWGLLDLRALQQLVVEPERVLDLGATDRVEHLRAFVLADHVLSMEQAYPLATEQVGFRNSVFTYVNEELLNEEPLQEAELSAVSEFFSGGAPAPPDPAGRVGASRGKQEEDAEAEPVVEDAEAEPVVEDAEAEPAVEDTGDVYERFAVQLGMDGQKIDRIYLGSRPPAPSGRHATAWVVLCDYARSRIADKELPEVPQAVQAARKKIAKIGTGLGQQARVAGFDGRADDDQAMQEDHPGGEGVTLARAQKCVADFLTDLNKLDGSIVDTGGSSPGKTEQRHRVTLLTGEAGYAEVAGMLDSRALAWHGNPDQIAFRVAVHLCVTDAAYRAVIPILSMSTFAALLVPVELQDDVMETIVQRVLGVLDSTAHYSSAEFQAAAEQFRHERAERAKEKAKPGMYESEDDYRESLDSDVEGDSGSSYASEGEPESPLSGTSSSDSESMDTDS